MSVFTNPASGAAGQAEAYTRAILELLGSRDPLAVLGSTVQALPDAVAGLSAAQLSAREAPGKWSIRHVLRHLADSEVVWAWRMRLVLAQDRPPLTGYDQDAWAERLGYADADPAQSIAEFGVLRTGNLALLARASEADRLRAGVHTERGDESIAHMIRMYAGHDLLHLRQIERIRNAVEGDRQDELPLTSA
jgi:uncharacterized damage-inducible protein DinB